jgi:hypothetical protein
LHGQGEADLWLPTNGDQALVAKIASQDSFSIPGQYVMRCTGEERPIYEWNAKLKGRLHRK